MSDEGSATGDAEAVALVLDYLPHGRADDTRPQYRKPPLALVVDQATFALYELVLDPEADVSIGDRVPVDPPGDHVEDVRRISYDELSGGARAELEHVVADLVETEEDRFVSFFNEAQPVTLRLHQLTLLPGIGDKLRDSIIDARRRTPFEGFDDLEERIAGLHDPQGTLVDRILEEIRDEDVKYKLFVRPE